MAGVTKSLLLVVLLGASCAHAAEAELDAALRQGLFEEEANQNLNAAVESYGKVLAGYDAGRKLAATAVFRLGECYRKLLRTNEAVAQYRRLVREFSDQTALLTLSRQSLAGLGIQDEAPPPASDGSGSSRAPLLQAISKQELELADTSALLQGLKPHLGGDRKAVVSLLTTTVPDTLLNQLASRAAEIESRIAALSASFTKEHPTMREQTTALDSVNRQIDERIAGVVAGLNLKVQIGERQLAALRLKLEESEKAQAGSLDVGSSAGTEEEGEIRRIRSVIANSPDRINSTTGGANPPLHEAAFKGQLRVTEFLLNNGAQVDLRNVAGETPLIVAASHGHKSVVELLLRRGADPNARASNRETALFRAVANDFRAVAEVLLAHKADPELGGCLHRAVSNGSQALVELLLRHGADVNAGRAIFAPAVSDAGGRAVAMDGTPLHIAVGKQSTNLVDLLIAHGAKPNATNDQGHAPLHLAAAKAAPTVVAQLLEAGANPNVIATGSVNHGRTPLYFAIETGSGDSVRALLNHGANPNVQADLTAGRRSEARQGWTPLLWAVETGNSDLVSLLLEAKADPNLSSAESWTPLLRSIVSTRNQAIAELLLKHGARADGASPSGESPLHHAVLLPNRAMIELLLRHGADPNVTNSAGQTALHRVVEKARGSQLIGGVSPNFPGVVLAPPPVPGAPGVVGSAPPMVSSRANPAPVPASRNEWFEIARLLLDHKADVNARDASDRSALNYFGSPPRPTSDTQQALVALLREHGAVDQLPRWDRIVVRRSSTGAEDVVFKRSTTNDWNRFTLLELIAVEYGLVTSQSGNQAPQRVSTYPHQNIGLPFPDLAHILIKRPSRNPKDKWTEIPVNLFATLVDSGTNCSGDVTLEWGDEVEIPELDHPVNETWRGLPSNLMRTLKHCLARTVTIAVKGQVTTLTLAPDVLLDPQDRLITNRRFMLGPALFESNLLRSSSDLSRVVVTRRAGDQTRRMVVAIATAGAPDLWLRDGDAIEVPDRTE